MATGEALGHPPAHHTEQAERVVLRSYPKFVLLYPTLIAALLAGIGTHYGPDATRWSLWFLIVMILNLVVLAFDFPRTTSLGLLFFILAVLFGVLWLNVYLNFLPRLKEFTEMLQPRAGGQFYAVLAGGMILIYLFVFLDTRFDYWEIMPNEIIHHHGVLGDVNRFPAPQLKLEKEITDVFEFFLLRSGRLILQPSSERRAIVLDNVPNINKRELEIQNLLRALTVHVHNDEEADHPI